MQCEEIKSALPLKYQKVFSFSPAPSSYLTFTRRHPVLMIDNFHIMMMVALDIGGYYTPCDCASPRRIGISRIYLLAPSHYRVVGLRDGG